MPGRTDPQFDDASVPNKTLDLLASRIVMVAPEKSAFNLDDVSNGQIFLFGKGRMEARQFGPKLFICPGPLVTDNSGREPGLALVEVGRDEIIVNFYDPTLARLGQRDSAHGGAFRISQLETTPHRAKGRFDGDAPAGGVQSSGR